MDEFEDEDWDDLNVPAQVLPPVGRFGLRAFRRVGDDDQIDRVGFANPNGFDRRGFGARENAAGGFGANIVGYGDVQVGVFFKGLVNRQNIKNNGFGNNGFGANARPAFVRRGRFGDSIILETSKSIDQIAAEKAKKLGMIKKTETLIDDISKLHANQDMSDVVLIAEGERFPAHKFLLSIRSNYFKAMFCTGLRESTEKEISLMDTPAKPFSLLLQYVYTGQMQLQTADYQQTLEVFALAHKYEFPVLEEQIVEHLQAILNVDNISGIYSGAELFDSEKLLDSCIGFLKTYKRAAVTSNHFLNFPLNVMKVIVQKVDWSGSEEVIINNLKRWIIANIEQIEELRPIIQTMQLELVQIGQKLHLVKTWGVIE